MVGSRNSDENAAEKTAKHGTADVNRHYLRHAMSRPLFGDVGDGDAENSRHHDALQKTPEDQLRQPVCGGCHNSGQCDQKDGEHDDLAASDALGQRSAKGRAQGNAEGCGADGAADLRFGGVEDLLEERQQRLGGVEIEKCADPGERHRDDGAGIVRRARRLRFARLWQIDQRPAPHRRSHRWRTDLFPEAWHDTSVLRYHRERKFQQRSYGKKEESQDCSQLEKTQSDAMRERT